MTNYPVTIEYFGQRQSLKLAVFRANQLLKDDAFFEHITKLAAFADADISPAAIAELIHHADIAIDLDVYMATDPQDTTEGYYDAEDPLSVHINMYKTGRPVPELSNTIIRLCVQAINAQYPQYNFGADKEKGAPKSIGMVAEHLISQQLLASELLGKDDMITNLKYIRH